MLNLDRQAALNNFKKIFNFVEEYYPIIIGTILLINTLHVYFINATPGYKVIVSIYWFVFLTAYKDMRKDVKWLPFVLLSIPLGVFLWYINKNGYTIWGQMLNFERKLKIVVDFNPIFKSIPFNNGAIFRMYKSDNLTWFFRLVYNNGFILPPMICILRSVIIRDYKKIIRYMCSAHVFQIFLISPFYIIFHLQEVWFVYGHPDGVGRHFHSYAEMAGTALNCFPSMHTSIAFAAFLLVLREKDKVFKCVWGFFCLSVIYSTLYLEVHWVIDVLGGLVLAYCSVKLADFVIEKIQKKIQPLLDKYYYRSTTSAFEIDNNSISS
ncbi:phosphatase PAP2 family protein [Clostridium neuense]|uniref:Phosphatase PAP2 family protein n=1 Tax=Clostridium neuense TaxID=1728934 RepID=A0ABW8TAT7_9CLOT